MISCAGKASGTNKMWLNVQNIPQQDQQSVSSDLIDWKYKEEEAPRNQQPEGSLYI